MHIASYLRLAVSRSVCSPKVPHFLWHKLPPRLLVHILAHCLILSLFSLACWLLKSVYLEVVLRTPIQSGFPIILGIADVARHGAFCWSGLRSRLIHMGGFPGDSVEENLPADVGDAGSIPELERSPGAGSGNSLQYSCRGNPMDRGVQLATVHGVAKSWAWLSTHTSSIDGDLMDSPWSTDLSCWPSFTNNYFCTLIKSLIISKPPFLIWKIENQVKLGQVVLHLFLHP